MSGSDGSIIQHMRTCLRCRHGLTRLSSTGAEEWGGSILTCEQCLALLPTYYEATHSDHPLVNMSERELTDVVHHLVGCDVCGDAYEDLAALAALEERDDFDLL